jgi:antitoxin FitA
VIVIDALDCAATRNQTGQAMASITIRQLSDETKQRLAEQAARNGRSLEAELRDILDAAALKDAAPDAAEPFGSWAVRVTRPGFAEFEGILAELDRETNLSPIAGASFDL